MEVIKTRMQISTANGSQPSGRQLLKNILQTEGPRGLLRGYPLGLAVFGPYSITYFVFYEKFKTILIPKDEASMAFRYWLASSISVAIAATISNPMDVIKVRWQSADYSSRDKSVSSLVRRLIREEGAIFKPFLRGTLSRVAWLVPSTSITFTMFEILKDMFVTEV
ncbi:hypothetical protein DSO57_1013058 [Entomophthora muscae]|uniref:Uncharacterized protein n=1 Tax=Entomophthora muscae TaxID=34485 RepID=A0ACC2TST0_9FUNG|nr:hypothetical protein DSO57_1013058 [Entomophthora muscae]